MNRYAMMETKCGKVLFGGFLFAMLLLARDTMITTTLLGFTKSQVLMLGLICAYGFMFLLRNRREWKEILTDRRMLAMAVSAAVLLIPMLLKRDWQMMYFSILICLLLPVFLSYFISLQNVARYYVMSITFLGAYSLLGMYVLKWIANAGLIPATIFYNSQGAGLYNFGFACVVPDPYWYRNFGIFREPGVYQFFLILGLYLNHYVADWKKESNMWISSAILAVTMFTTFAIGGFIEMGLFAVFLYFDKKYYRSKLGKFLAAAAITAVTALVIHIILEIRKPYFELTIYYEFFDMFKRLTTDSDSLIDRLGAITTGVTLFFRNPLLGDTISNVLHGTAHNTSSTMILFSALGIFGGLLHVASWIALLWKKERHIIGNVILLMILFMSFNTQNLTADVFFWLFPYLALTEVVLKNWKISERKA